MRRLALIIALTVASHSGATAQATPAPAAAQAVDAATRAQLEQAREAVWRAWFAGDSTALERLIPRAVAAGSPGGWEDRAATLEGSRQSAAGGRRLVEISFDSTTIALHDRLAIMHARFTYVLEGTDGKRVTARGIATEVFVRQNGQWVNPFWYLQ
jgi:hypothetical protein